MFVAMLAGVTAGVIGARHLDPVPQGVRVQYFANANPAGGPELSGIDREPATESVFSDWSGRPTLSFTAIWSGWLLAPDEGRYTFGLSADQSATLEIDGEVVADTRRTRARVPVTGTMTLQRGPHSLFLRYVHDAGVPALSVSWSQADSSLEPVPVWALRTRQISYRRFATDRVLDAAEAASSVALVLAVLWAAWTVWGTALTSLGTRWIGVGVARPLLCVVAGSMVLNVIGITWGLPQGDWVGDELGPFFVLDALAHRFGRGWFTIYPPFHYYVLTLAYAPVFAASWLGFIGLHTTLAHGLMALSGRLVSLLMAAGMIVAVFVGGRRTFGSRAGLFAAALFALATPFVYSAKTANVDVPYLFWLALSLACYLGILTDGSLAAYIGCVVTATLAVCTKDQAYAFCAGMAPVVLFELWRKASRANVPRPMWRAITDRRVAVAVVALVLTFVVAENLVFNLSGFLQHVATITGRQVSAYQSFAPTVNGRLSLLVLTGHLVELSWGWPAFLVCALGLGWALTSPADRRAAIWLLVPALSYYLGFINVVLYNYDRFVLPLCLVLALFGGFAIDRLTAACTSYRSWRLAASGVLLIYTLLYSGTVDALMVRDSRYGVERWLADHVREGDLVGTTGIARYLPRLDPFATVDLDRPETLTKALPRFCIVNADYTRSEAVETPLGQVIAQLESGAAGYRLVLRARSSSPWPWLPGAHPDLVGDRLDLNSTSFLRNINPTIEIFERR
ncbi:MAG TPA: PA14 domain-containing protein [Vicinamibacterales bacterium]